MTIVDLVPDERETWGLYLPPRDDGAPPGDVKAALLRNPDERGEASSNQGSLVQVHQSALTELLLLGALREATRADAADEARRKLEQTHAALGRYLAEMVHEFRTPLQAVGGYADLMALGIHGPLTEEQQNALARIHAGVLHLVELTSAILDHAKIGSGNVDYAITDVRVGTTMDAAASLVGPQADARGVAVFVDQRDAQLLVRADSQKLLQVVLNLLGNSVKSCDAGGTITVIARKDAVVPGMNASVTISVTDTGCGIAAGQLGQVFEPFMQVGRRSGELDTGTGLGLSISRELVHGMHGEIAVESTLGVGTTFTVTLPQPD